MELKVWFMENDAEMETLDIDRSTFPGLSDTIIERVDASVGSSTTTLYVHYAVAIPFITHCLFCNHILFVR